MPSPIYFEKVISPGEIVAIFRHYVDDVRADMLSFSVPRSLSAVSPYGKPGHTADNMLMALLLYIPTYTILLISD